MRTFIVVGEDSLTLAQQDKIEAPRRGIDIKSRGATIGHIVETAKRYGIGHDGFWHLHWSSVIPNYLGAAIMPYDTASS